MSVCEQIKVGLDDSVAYSKGTMWLRISELAALPQAGSADDVRALRRLPRRNGDGRGKRRLQLVAC